jgi:phospholipid/cholesterol/gamma-HCH transport system substrate-binding protein
MKPIRNEVKIALVGIVAIIILYFGMQFLKGLTMVSSDNNYYAHFKDVSGLSASSPVYVNGVKVGTVESLDYDYARPDNILAVIGLDEELNVPQGTTAEIASDLLGNVRLERKLGAVGGPLVAFGATIN